MRIGVLMRLLHSMVWNVFFVSNFICVIPQVNFKKFSMPSIHKLATLLTYELGSNRYGRKTIPKYECPNNIVKNKK